jgi:PPP family 3-phenylpropionic acid transporter
MPVMTRFGLFYAAIFLGTGASVPFMPLWFKAHGLTGAQTGILLSIPALMRIFSGPLVGAWADGFRLRRTSLMVMALGAAIAYAVLGLGSGFWFYLAFWILSQNLIVSMSPQTDVLTLEMSQREGFSYGLARGIGSGGFILGNLGMGLVASRFGLNAVLIWAVLAAILTAIMARWMLPPVVTAPHLDQSGLWSRWASTLKLLTRPGFVVAILSTSLIQGSHAFYYGFSTLIWKQAGVSEFAIGCLWGLGVFAEIIFLIVAEPWRHRVSGVTLVVLGGLAALVRWGCLALAPPLWALFLLQPLHAFTFASVFIGGLSLTQSLAPVGSGSSGQMIYSALAGGLIIGLATMVSGTLYDHFGNGGYWAMCAMVVAGLCGMVAFSRFMPLREAV